MSVRSSARQLRDRSADALRRLQLRGGLARLDRVLRDGKQPSALLLRQLAHGWGNEAWSASTGLLDAALRWFSRSRGPALECGSGLTTLGLAAAAGASGRLLLSLEHDEVWAARARASLPVHLRGAVTVAAAPIRSYDTFDWYGLEHCQLPAQIGFVLCDGPPGSTRGGRYGLAPVLRTYLMPGCIVLLDDTQRPEEQAIVGRWCLELGATVVEQAGTFTVLRVGGGLAPVGDPAAPSPRAPGAYGSRPAAHALSILALAPNEWDGMWMNRQYLLSRLAARYPILYSTGARSTWDREFLSPARGGLFGRFTARDGVVIDDPPHLPFRTPGVRLLDRVAIRITAHRWRRRLARGGRSRLVAYLFHPDYAVFLDALQPDYLVYHCYDLLRRTPGWNAAVEACESQLLQRANLVVASSRVIAEDLRERSGRPVHVVPNGVDFEAFARPAAGGEPADLAAIPRPRIAHVGRLNPKVDIELLIALARRYPRWSFALVGPVVDLDPRTAALYESARAIPNLHLLGVKTRQELPRYVQAVDVGLLAYRTGALWTEGIYPLKLHEYLATGLPIVSADLPAVRDFADVVSIASTLEEWGAAIQAALAGDTAEKRRLRTETARANSWQQRADRIVELLHAMTSQ